MQLDAVDQDVMLTIRQAWFDECGAPPPGNKLALERKAWQVSVWAAVEMGWVQGVCWFCALCTEGWCGVVWCGDTIGECGVVTWLAGA
jgi:hypothetical protein